MGAFNIALVGVTGRELFDDCSGTALERYIRYRKNGSSVSHGGVRPCMYAETSNSDKRLRAGSSARLWSVMYAIVETEVPFRTGCSFLHVR